MVYEKCDYLNRKRQNNEINGFLWGGKKKQRYAAHLKSAVNFLVI
jgi:hypothetical protein